MMTSDQTDDDVQEMICKDGDCGAHGETELTSVRYIKESNQFCGHEVISIAII